MTSVAERKLTKAQKELLAELESKGVVYCVDTYKPMLRLTALGYATIQQGRWDHVHVRITEAGRSALNAESGR